MTPPLNVKNTGQEYDLNLFFEHSADLLCIAGFDGYFKRVNPAMVDLMGYTEQELKSRPVTEFILPEDRVITKKFHENLAEGKPLLNFENRYQNKNGEAIWLSWSSIPDTKRKLVYAVAKNVTHYRKISEDRNLLISNLTRTNNDLKRLTFSTTHDLRSPLSNIIGILSILDFSKIKDDDTLDLLHMLKVSAEKMNRTLERQIDTLKETEKVIVDVSDISLNKCLNTTVESIRSYIKTSKTEISEDFTDFDIVRFNKAYMESIFLNLVTNSIRYAKPNETPKISIKTDTVNGVRRLVFSDNGIGMDMDKVKGKIFGFNQTFHDYKESKGIGLYLVSNHVQAMGGSIHVESEVDKGSTFTITFP